MGRLFETLKNKFVEKIEGINSVNYDEVVQDNRYKDDWETRDNYLKSLRRQVRRLQDQEEKKELQRVINAEARQRDAAWLGDGGMLRSNYFNGGDDKMKRKGKRTSKRKRK